MCEVKFTCFRHCSPSSQSTTQPKATIPFLLAENPSVISKVGTSRVNILLENFFDKIIAEQVYPQIADVGLFLNKLCFDDFLNELKQSQYFSYVKDKFLWPANCNPDERVKLSYRYSLVVIEDILMPFWLMIFARNNPAITNEEYFNIVMQLGIGKEALKKMNLLSFVPKDFCKKRYRLFVAEIETKAIELLKAKLKFKDIIIILSALKSVSPKYCDELYNFIKRNISEIKQLFNLQVNGYYIIDANVFRAILFRVFKSVERERALNTLIQEFIDEHTIISAKIVAIQRKDNLETERAKLILDLKADFLQRFNEGVRKRSQ